VCNGDILGCSGISGSVILNPRAALFEKKWETVFLSSFMITSNLYNTYVIGGANAAPNDLTNDVAYVSTLGFAIAGLLVGFGSRVGEGCTSGHGLCGLARLSKRSLVGVITFMGTGMITASLVSLSPDSILRTTAEGSLTSPYVTESLGTIILILSIFILGVSISSSVQMKTNADAAVPAGGEIIGEASSLLGGKEARGKVEQLPDDYEKFPIAAFSAAIFSIGLAISGMICQYKIIDFLDLTRFADRIWDGTLAFVMGGGLMISLAGYQWVKDYGIVENQKALECPLLLDKSSGKFNIPCNTRIVDSHLLVGCAIFGVGWAIGGLCPGPGIFAFSTGNPKVVSLWFPMYIIGNVLGDKANKLFPTA